MYVAEINVPFHVARAAEKFCSDMIFDGLLSISDWTLGRCGEVTNPAEQFSSYMKRIVSSVRYEGKMKLRRVIPGNLRATRRPPTLTFMFTFILNTYFLVLGIV